MPSHLQLALEQLARESRSVAPGRPFEVHHYRPEDGPGLARLFYAVYGPGYPVDTFYLPEALTRANQSGALRSVVAVTDHGDVVSHEALMGTSSPNPALYEIGLGLTLPAYRATLAYGRCHRLLMSLLGTPGIDAIFGEPVCNLLVTQKICEMTASVETALEPALMPASLYGAEGDQVGRVCGPEGDQAGRVGCLMFFRVFRDRPRRLCLPPAYGAELEYLMAGLNLERERIPAWNWERLPATGARIEEAYFANSGVARCSVQAPGQDLVARLRQLEDRLLPQGCVLIQCFVPLGEGWAGPVVDDLRREGYFLGGFLPLWFQEDGLLMQKVFIDPDFDGLQLRSERAGRIRDLVQADFQRAQAPRKDQGPAPTGHPSPE